MANQLNTLELDRVLTLIAMEAKSAPGKEAVLRRHPLATIEQCEAAQADLADMAPLFARETVLELDESWLIIRAARATQAIRETFARDDRFPRLARLASAIPDLGELLTKTNKFF